MDHQLGNPQSVLNLYKNALRIRHELALGRAEFEWDPMSEQGSQILAYRLTTESGDTVLVAANAGDAPVEIPELTSGELLLASGQSAVMAGKLAVDHTVWIKL